MIKRTVKKVQRQSDVNLMDLVERVQKGGKKDQVGLLQGL